MEARRKPPRARANRGEERARQPSGPVQGRRIAKRTHPKAISRLPSGAGRNARRPLARGKARLARSSPHDDRHRTNGTKLPRADRQAAIPAPRKKSPPVPDHAKNAFEPMFSGVRRIFGIIYPGFSGIRVPVTAGLTRKKKSYTTQHFVHKAKKGGSGYADIVEPKRFSYLLGHGHCSRIGCMPCGKSG